MLQDLSGNIVLPASGAAAASTAIRAPSTASDQQLFQRHIALTSGGAVAAVSDISSAFTAAQQGQQHQQHQQAHPQQQQQQQDAPSSPSRATATPADGESDMTTLIVDIQVRVIPYSAARSHLSSPPSVCGVS